MQIHMILRSASKNKDRKHDRVYERYSRTERDKSIHIRHALEHRDRAVFEKFVIYRNYSRCEYQLIQRKPLFVIF